MHTHTHRPSRRNALFTKLIEHLHNTELWANYLPVMPPWLYFPAMLGGTLLATALLARPRHKALTWATLGVGTTLTLPTLAAALFVRWRSRLRTRLRAEILDALTWRGDEQVLDVGCGSGLLLNGAAQRLTSGTALGIDIWETHGGGGNLDLLMRNARREHVAERITFQTADARHMPFDAATFDIIMSSGAIHHISHTRTDFDLLMHELLRVLKPGGQIVIWDVAHLVEACAQRFTAAGLECRVTAIAPYLGFEMARLHAQRLVIPL